MIFLTGLATTLAAIPVHASKTTAAENSWVAVAQLPANATSGNAIAFNGKLYFFGGVYEQYDPQTDTWTAIAPPPVYNGWNVVACQNKIYYIGADTSIPTQVYDPSTETWKNKTAQTPDLPHIMRAIAVGDKIYVIGGGNPTLGAVVAYNQTYVYNTASDSWSTMAPLPVAVYYYASAVLDGKIYIIGGGTFAGFSQNATNLVQIFDPKLNQWTNGSAVPTGIISAGACATSGLSTPKRIYVVGGALRYGAMGIEVYSDDRRTAINLNQVFDPTTGKWSFAASLPDERRAFSLVNVGDKLYAVGGLDSIKYSKVMLTVYEYTPIGYNSNTSPIPSSSVPEFSWLTFLPLLLSVFSFAVVLRHRKQVKKV